MNRKLTFRWIKVLLLLYCIIGTIFYYTQEKLLTHPVAVQKDTAYRLAQAFTELDGGRFVALGDDQRWQTAEVDRGRGVDQVVEADHADPQFAVAR